MKKLALFAIAAGAAALGPQSASAQVMFNPGGFGNGGGFGGGNFFGGFAFGGFFHQPQFHVQNWQLYGFINPGQDRRWVRYYDDAYLVDHRGYIHDRRQRVNWNRHGERWERDHRGIPYYAGRGDYRPDRRDYDYVAHERGGYRGGGYDRGYDRGGGGYGGGWDYSSYGSSCGSPSPCGGSHPPAAGYSQGGYGQNHAYGGYDRGHAAPPPQAACGGYVCGGSGAYGYSGYPQGYSAGHGGYGYGYGAGGGGVMIVTETTVSPSATTTVTEEIVEEVVEERAVQSHRAAPRVRHYRPAPVRHRPAPRRVVTPGGERG